LGTNYWILDGDHFVAGDVILMERTILVTGHARLFVTGGFVFFGASEIKIQAGATLELFVGGGQTTLPKLTNSEDPSKFVYYGLPRNTNVTVVSGSEFKGAIYAPAAAFSISAPGSGMFHFYGACVVNSAILNGHISFHLDENLLRGRPLDDAPSHQRICE